MIEIKEDKGIFYIEKTPLELVPLLHNKYESALPFPHIILDNFFPDIFLNKVLQHFPKKEKASVYHKSNTQHLKRGYRAHELKNNPCHHYLELLNTAPMLTFLEALTGVSGLIPDPYYTGGGLHETIRGGYLDIHTDFTWHKKLNLARRLNMIIFLNKEWKPGYNGNLELWDAEMKEKVIEIEPIYNRVVIFNTTEHSYHGQPQPVNCPKGMSRRSIALYYYTNMNNVSYLTDKTKWKSNLNNSVTSFKITNYLKSLFR